MSFYQKQGKNDRENRKTYPRDIWSGTSSAPADHTADLPASVVSRANERAARVALTGIKSTFRRKNDTIKIIEHIMYKNQHELKRYANGPIAVMEFIAVKSRE